MVFLITYDLNKEKDYPNLFKAIESLGETFRDTGLKSVWFVSTNLSSDQINLILYPKIDSNDRLFITEVSQYSGWMHQTTWNWISSRL